MSELGAVFLDAKLLDKSSMEALGDHLAEWQRGVNWWIGDLAREAERRSPKAWQQVFPTWMSPGLILRCKAVAEAYPAKPDRNELATWSQHMSVAKKADRIALVAAMVEAGETTDQTRARETKASGPRWLLAVDVHYWLHRTWHSGAGVESAVQVAGWVQRTVARLQEKGLTDVACCFDSRVNSRKELTTEWEDRYKDRPAKDPELSNQLELIRKLLEGHGYACVAVEGWEADDVMASYAKQFAGKVTLLTQDKDARQCLSATCNILLDVEWIEDETSGELLPSYKWISYGQHTRDTGVPPERWTEYQALAGDACDGIKGAVGIGAKGAADLVSEFGTIDAAIEAAKADDERIKPAKRKALIEFEAKMETTRKLVTLRTDLELNHATRIA